MPPIIIQSASNIANMHGHPFRVYLHRLQNTGDPPSKHSRGLTHRMERAGGRAGLGLLAS